MYYNLNYLPKFKKKNQQKTIFNNINQFSVNTILKINNARISKKKIVYNYFTLKIKIPNLYKFRVKINSA